MLICFFKSQNQPPVSSTPRALQSTREIETVALNPNKLNRVISPIIPESRQLSRPGSSSFNPQSISPDTIEQQLNSESLPAQRGNPKNRATPDQPHVMKQAELDQPKADKVATGLNHDSILPPNISTLHPTSNSGAYVKDLLTLPNPKLHNKKSNSPHEATNTSCKTGLLPSLEKGTFRMPNILPPPNTQLETSTKLQSSDTSKFQKPTPQLLQEVRLPERYRTILATATLHEINLEPLNAAKGVTVEGIRGILGRDLHFSQLCDILEARGLLIDRKRLAQALLDTVYPNMNQNGAPTKIQSGGGSAQDVNLPHKGSSGEVCGHPPKDSLPSGSVANSLGLSSASSLNNQIPQGSANTSKTQPLYGSPYPATKQVPKTQPIKWADSRNRTAGSIERQHITNIERGHVTPSPKYLLDRAREGFSLGNASSPHVNKQSSQHANQMPSSKADMARKRSFNEIVDLSQGVSSDEESKPPKQPRIEELRNGKWSPLENQNTLLGIPNSSAQSKPRTLGSVGEQPARMFDLSSYRAPVTHMNVRDDLRSAMVVRPLDKSKALRRNNYDARTVARDVLISNGRHPTERPLNWHLESLRTVFQHVTQVSDLSTLRWDLIDPDGPTQALLHSTVLDAQNANDEAAVENIQSEGYSQTFVRHPQSTAIDITGGDVHFASPGKVNKDF